MVRNNIIIRNIYVPDFLIIFAFPSSYYPLLNCGGGGGGIKFHLLGKKHPRPPFQLINIGE